MDQQIEHTDEKINDMSEIFNIIFKYQEDILDGDYLRINTIAHSIMKENEELSKLNEELSQININMINENNIINEKNRYLDDDNNRLVKHNAELYKIIKELKETLSISNDGIHNISKINKSKITFTYDDDDEKDCHCMNRWCFSDTSERKTTDYESFFCMDNLKECDNFKELCKHCPLMDNLFGKSDAKFFEDFSEKEDSKKFDFHYIAMILKILITLIENNSASYNKTLIILVLHDFIIRNMNFLLDIKYKNFVNMVKKKFEEFYDDKTIFIPIAESYNINIDKWYKIIHDIVLE